ncbi:MAG: DUF6058 family natural product biosynthesis protein [Pseudomonadota bacterium]
MLLSYLYSNFFEERDFAEAVGLSPTELNALFIKRILPGASYRLDLDIRSSSFVANHQRQDAYRFHLKGHLDWVKAIQRLSLESESGARAYFEARYGLAKSTFLCGSLGCRLDALAPEVIAAFDADRAEATWVNFLAGVYGVCTRDGQPESVFLKQAAVDFVDHLIALDRIEETAQHLPLLHELVDFLDGVESDFAPHEVAQSSRQRCIVDVRTRFSLPVG